MCQLTSVNNSGGRTTLLRVRGGRSYSSSGHPTHKTSEFILPGGHHRSYMKNRFLLQDKEAASGDEAAFILDIKTKFKARVLVFRTVQEMGQYPAVGQITQVRQLPMLLEAASGTIPEAKQAYWLKRMADWYYYTQINPPPAGTPSASGSAD